MDPAVTPHGPSQRPGGRGCGLLAALTALLACSVGSAWSALPMASDPMQPAWQAPPPAAAPAATPGTAVPAEPAPPLPAATGPTLKATRLGPEGWRALIDDRWVGPDERWGDYRVATVTAEQVVLLRARRGGKPARLVLRLHPWTPHDSTQPAKTPSHKPGAVAGVAVPAGGEPVINQGRR